MLGRDKSPVIRKGLPVSEREDTQHWQIAHVPYLVLGRSTRCYVDQWELVPFATPLMLELDKGCHACSLTARTSYCMSELGTRGLTMPGLLVVSASYRR